jgi:DNA-binding CsgD family transcriptional regulator/PAS domain-containing protein
MKSGDAKIRDLIAAIYDAAGDAALWPPLLGELARLSQATSAGLIMHHSGLENYSVLADWQVDPEAATLYNRYYGPLDIWARGGRSKPTGYVCTSQERCRLEQLRQTEFYCDFLSRFSIGHGMFGLVENSPTRWASLSLFRSSSNQAFDPQDLGILNQLMPHLRRAFLLHFRLSDLQAHSSGLAAALNMLSTGVIFVDSQGRVLLMNDFAETIIRRKEGLTVVNGKLGAIRHEETKALGQMIYTAARAECAAEWSPGGTVFVSRTKGRQLSVTVAPVRNVDTGIGSRPAAVLFVVDPDRAVEPPETLMKSVYGLTEAESKLAIVLLDGCSLKAAADACTITHNTAKTHLKRIFEKTGVTRQSELVRLLLRCASPFHVSPGS